MNLDMHDYEPMQPAGARILEFTLARARRGISNERVPRQLSIPLQEAPSSRDTLPDGAGRLQVGLSSWTDKGLIASMRFYPKGCSSPEERLRFYAAQFQTTGVDCSFALPSDRNARLWVERTPSGFTFNVKVLRLFTGHPMFAQTLPRDIVAALGPRLASSRKLYYRDLPDELRTELWDRFKQGLRPLHQAGRLGSIMLRFPDWVAPGAQSHAHVRECARHLRGYPLAVEFDHAGWLGNTHAEATLALERELGIVHVISEVSLDGNEVLRPWEVTTPKLAVVRVDGRASLRAEEPIHLDRLVRQANSLARYVERVQVIFEHSIQNEAALRAVWFQEVLEMLVGRD